MVDWNYSDFYEIFRVPPLSWPGPVVYAAGKAAPGVREALAARLLAALAELAPRWAQALTGAALIVETGPWGQPLLKLGGRPGPSLSFSQAGKIVWGAMAAEGRVGVDAALEADFASPYPYSRAFRPHEWGWAWRHCQGRTTAAAALLWAAKEAAVKALGMGFHTRDFRDLEVYLEAPADDGLLVVVKTPEAVSAWTRPLPDGWLALAVI